MFCSVDGLYELEQHEEWSGAVECIYKEWQKQKDNSSLLVRLIGECWYILSMWDCCMPTETMSYSKIEAVLYEGIRYGQLHFAQVGYYLCFVGYMLVATPFLFDSSALLNGVDPTDEGMRMLHLSTQLEPNNPVFQLLYLGYSDNQKRFKELQQEHQFHIGQLCCDETALTQYFKYILLQTV